jgi:hypothetical protein
MCFYKNLPVYHLLKSFSGQFDRIPGDYNRLDTDQLLKIPIPVVDNSMAIDHGVLNKQMPTAADEQLAQILHDNQLLITDVLLNITKRQSCLQTASRRTGYLKFFIQIVGLEVINIFVVPLSTLSTVPFPLTLQITTGLLPIFKSWMGHKPPLAYPARTLAHGPFAHRYLSC